MDNSVLTRIPVDNSVDNLCITLNKTPQEPVKGTQGGTGSNHKLATRVRRRASTVDTSPLIKDIIKRMMIMMILMVMNTLFLVLLVLFIKVIPIRVYRHLRIPIRVYRSP